MWVLILVQIGQWNQGYDRMFQVLAQIVGSGILVVLVLPSAQAVHATYCYKNWMTKEQISMPIEGGRHLPPASATRRSSRAVNLSGRIRVDRSEARRRAPPAGGCYGGGSVSSRTVVVWCAANGKEEEEGERRGVMCQKPLHFGGMGGGDIGAHEIEVLSFGLFAQPSCILCLRVTI
ncbi:hypothetical protein SETIT_1G156500v2 [Setaria italica]|uniref:Uncharacterized protein n=1 Tax=Setaria italica TaxID=4555 RepID=A0A368PKQ5_SETIT|nr:hypothetical protein SETIT_1G156500v2 [Setaria italica]